MTLATNLEFLFNSGDFDGGWQRSTVVVNGGG